jgi:hypothetical protein
MNVLVVPQVLISFRASFRLITVIPQRYFGHATDNVRCGCQCVRTAKIWQHESSVRKEMTFKRIVMRQRTAVLICLVSALMSGKAAGAESSDGIALMRMHLECGWLRQVSAGSDELTETNEYHINAGTELAVDLGLERQELADEVSPASRRVLDGSSEAAYLGERFVGCRGLVPLDVSLIKRTYVYYVVKTSPKVVFPYNSRPGLKSEGVLLV